VHIYSVRPDKFATIFPLGRLQVGEVVWTNFIPGFRQFCHVFGEFFLPREAMRKRGRCCLSVSVCPSVRPSDYHVGALYPDGWRYRQTSFSPRLLHHSSFYDPSVGTQFQREPLQRRRKIHEGGKILRFSAEITVPGHSV